jgi:hypothetical protein
MGCDEALRPPRHAWSNETAKCARGFVAYLFLDVARRSDQDGNDDIQFGAGLDQVSAGQGSKIRAGITCRLDQLGHDESWDGN